MPGLRLGASRKAPMAKWRPGWRAGRMGKAGEPLERAPKGPRIVAGALQPPGSGSARRSRRKATDHAFARSSTLAKIGMQPGDCLPRRRR